MTTRQQVTEFIDGQKNLLSPTTIKAYRERLGRFLAFAGDRKITPAMMTKYIPSLLEAGLGRRSALAYYGTVQTLFVWLIDAGLTVGNPVPKLRRFVVPASNRQPILDHEYDNLMTLAREAGRWDWLYAIRCGWETGLRLGDIATLCWSEVDSVALCIKRTPIKTLRFGKVVEIPISEGLLRTMRECPPYAEGDPGFVSPRMAQQHKWDQHKSLSAQFSKLARKAGVKKSFHCLRHGFVARMLNRGVPAAVVQSFTGHSLRQLQGYSHVDMETKRAALNTSSTKPILQWQRFNDECPNCGSPAEVLTDTGRDNWANDGDEARCSECKWPGSVTVCEEPHAYVNWQDELGCHCKLCVATKPPPASAPASLAQAPGSAAPLPDPKTCDHKFVDSKWCLKCGWVPPNDKLTDGSAKNQ